MSRFNTRTARPAARGPITTTGEHITTFEGGAGFVRTARSELFLLAVSNMVGQNTFHESAPGRDSRYVRLVQQLAVEDPEWTVGLLGWLRRSANMRTAAVVGAPELVKARLVAAAAGDLAPDDAAATAAGGGWNRKAVDSVLLRADEPGELLGYWTSRYGRRLPKPIKRGAADAVRRLYSGKSLLKYDTASHGYRFGDVLNLVHATPDPDKPWQGDLFAYALDRRHHPDTAVPPASNRTLTARAALMAVPVTERRALLLAPDGPERLTAAAMTWEALAGWLQGPMDAAAWEAIIPTMGLMALARNLRNFDEAGVSDKTAEWICARLADPEEVRASRQFPYRFLSAYRAAPSLRWSWGLEQALTAAAANVPALPGRTLALVDTSASMRDRVSEQSQIRHVDVAALFGCVVAQRATGPVDLVGFADGSFVHPVSKGGSVLSELARFDKRIGEVGHGTATFEAVRQHYAGHDRVVIFHDGQYGSFRYSWPDLSRALPPTVPMFSVDTSGYAPAPLDTSQPNRYEIGGFSDACFTMIDLLSRGRDAGWPWELPAA
ncbi:TROVE domain-containing protein [Streptomyces sp. NPDC004237]|uniref:TROVE domain-containing protein n=1 Tax=Streptomyces sp. NPDC004237 TaxID=3154455 RepID=UPI0033B462A9